MKNSQLMVPINIVKSIADSLVDYGVDLESVLAGVGVNSGLLSDTDAQIPQDTLTKLWEKSVELTSDSSFGITAGARVSIFSYPEISYSFISCANLLEVCKRIFRYQRLLSEGFQFGFEKLGEEYLLTFNIIPDQCQPSIQAFDGAMATFITTVDWITHQQIKPLRAGFKRSKPDSLKHHDKLFPGPKTFEDNAWCLYFSTKDMELDLPSANEQLSKIHDANADKYLSKSDRGPFTKKVQNLIVTNLPSGDPKQEKIAALLFVSSSTLKRRLQTEGVHYSDLLSDIRHQLAKTYLTNDELSLMEVTYLLGFAEYTSFNRAFKRWESVTPKQWRTHDSSERKQ